MSPRSDREARALSVLARESAHEPIPAIDWERVEHGLLAKVEATPPASVVPLWRRRGLGVAGAAIAAAAALVLMFQGETRRPVAPAPEARHVLAPVDPGAAPGATLLFDGATLAVGDVVEAPRSPVAYEHEGHVTWTLSPGARVEVAALDAAHSTTLRLERGTVQADVSHQDVGEAFAIEVGSTRVAVHGTSFSVTRDGDRAVVEVFHGSVAVGPIGHPGATQGWLVSDHERASFSTDGARDVRWLEPTAQAAPPSSEAPRANAPVAPLAVATPPPSARARDVAAPGAPPAAPQAEPAAEPLPAALSEADTGPVMGRILGEISGCYERQVAAAGGVRFSITSSLVVAIQPDGAVESGVFNPPLSPTLMACASDALGRTRFPRAQGSSRAQASFRLGR